MPVRIVELTPADVLLARATFHTMAAVFGEEAALLSDAYIVRLLARDGFIALAAVVDDSTVGGITAHVLPMTRVEGSEIFIYDLAVRADHQRRGIGRELVTALRAKGRRLGIDDVFVPADDEDDHALDFYRALGGAPSPVTIFTFGKPE